MELVNTLSKALYARSNLNNRPMFSRPCLAFGFAMSAWSAVNCSRSSTPPIQYILSEMGAEHQRKYVTFMLHVFSDLISGSRIQSFFFCHFFLHLQPWELRSLLIRMPSGMPEDKNQLYPVYRRRKILCGISLEGHRTLQRDHLRVACD